MLIMYEELNQIKLVSWMNTTGNSTQEKKCKLNGFEHLFCHLDINW